MIDETIDGSRYEGSFVCPSCLSLCFVSQHACILLASWLSFPLTSTFNFIYTHVDNQQDELGNCADPGKCFFCIILSGHLLISITITICRTSCLSWSADFSRYKINTSVVSIMPRVLIRVSTITGVSLSEPHINSTAVHKLYYIYMIQWYVHMSSTRLHVRSVHSVRYVPKMESAIELTEQIMRGHKPNSKKTEELYICLVTYKESEQKTKRSTSNFLFFAIMFCTSKSHSCASSGSPQTRPCMSLVMIN